MVWVSVILKISITQDDGSRSPCMGFSPQGLAEAEVCPRGLACATQILTDDLS
jgi:hypothetical protein